MRRFLLGLAILLSSSLAAAAVPKDEVHAAFTRFLALKSFRATIDATIGKYHSRSVLEFQAPDRYRITNEGKPANLIIGSIMYMNTDGHFTKIPMPNLQAMLAQYRNPDILKQLESGLAVENLGNEILNQQATRKYRYTTRKPQETTSTAWVAIASGDIVQVETTGISNKKPWHSLTQYSQFNSTAIKIQLP
jgi:hypothetical protein